MENFLPLVSTDSTTSTTTESTTERSRIPKFSGDKVMSTYDITSFMGAMFVTFLVSFVASFKQKKGIVGFFLANRSLTFFPMACSMVMSNIGSAMMLGIAGSASSDGMSIYAYELSSVLTIVALGWIFMPVYIASGSLTTVDYIKKRYGGMRMEIYLSLLTMVLILLTKTSVELYAINKLLQPLFIDAHWMVLSTPFLIWAILITAGGGLQAIVYTGTVQALILFVGGTFLSYFCFAAFKNFDDMRELYFEAWPNTTRIHFGGNATYKYTYCGIPNPNSWNIIRPYDNRDLPWPGMVFGIAITGLWYWCCDQLIVQVGLGAENIVQAKYACISAGYVKILTILFLVVPGMVARILYPNVVACADPSVCEAACSTRSGCSNLALPLVLLGVIPPNYRGMVLASVVSCCVSSLTSSLNSAGTIFTVNVYRNIRKVTTEIELLIVTKVFVLIMGLLSLMWVPSVSLMPALNDYMHSVVSVLTPPIAAVYLTGIFWDRVSEEIAFLSLLLGLALGGIRFLWSFSYGSVPCGEWGTSPVPDIISNFHFLHFGIFLFAICTIFIVIVGIFSEATSSVHLYRLLYWLRLSKLDRVDIVELKTEYKKIMGAKGKGKLKQFPPKPEVQPGSETVAGFPSILNQVCCVEPSKAAHLITNSEMRETVKQRANIDEPIRQARTLNLHAIMLLLVSAVLWGYFA